MTEPEKLKSRSKKAESVGLQRPSHLPRGRWLDDFPNLSVAERELVAACAVGRVWYPGRAVEEARPDAPTTENSIRGELIRFLLLGGDARAPVHEDGVMVRGAWITGWLSLHQAEAVVRLDMRRCTFEKAPDFTSARVPELTLSGSSVPGLLGDRLHVSGGVYFDEGFEAKGEVRLPGAKIGANLDCEGGHFINPGHNAICAHGMHIGGNVFLRTGFVADGEVRLVGSRIHGDLSCGAGDFRNDGAKTICADRVEIDGSVFLDDGFKSLGSLRFLSVKIGGELYFSGGEFRDKRGTAINLDGLIVAGGMFLRGADIDSGVNLTTSHIGTMLDSDLSCWMGGNNLLDGLHYDRIIGSLDANGRISWLMSQHKSQLENIGFAPQPWEQLIKTLREMGHPAEAAEVAIEKQRLMRKAGRIGNRMPRMRFQWAWRRALDRGWIKVSNSLARCFHDFYGWIAGYGYRPSRIIGRLALVWLICGGFYWAAADRYSAFGPTSPTITSSILYPEASQICGHGNDSGKQRWTECEAIPDEYTTFQPFIYSLDVVLPLIDLKQENDWAPIAEGPLGRDLLVGVMARWVMWFQILFGWVASLMFVAIVSRLVEKD
jgi:hypothetical protein